MWKLIEYAVYGAVGGFVGAATKHRSIELPRITRKHLKSGETVTHIDLGFLASPLLGGVLAALFDTNPYNAIAWGLAGGFAGPAILNALVDWLLKRFGLPLDLPELSELPKETP